LTTGDRLSNCLEAMRIGDEILAMGLYPFVPHLDLFWNLIFPKDYEAWLDWDFSWLEVCDAIFRIPGISPGADREVEYAKSLGKPIFYTLGELQDAIRLPF
jgi:hypothetical protein